MVEKVVWYICYRTLRPSRNMLLGKMLSLLGILLYVMVEEPRLKFTIVVMDYAVGNLRKIELNQLSKISISLQKQHRLLFFITLYFHRKVILQA